MPSADRPLALRLGLLLAVVFGAFVLMSPGEAAPARPIKKANRLSRPMYAPNHVLVKVRQRGNSAAVLNALAPRGMRLRKLLRGGEWMAVTLPPGQTPEDTVRHLKTEPGVANATRDPIVQALEVRPNDPFCNPPDWEKMAWCMEDLDRLFLQECQTPSTTNSGASSRSAPPPGGSTRRGVLRSSSRSWTAALTWTIRISRRTCGPMRPRASGTTGVDDDGGGYIDDIHGYDFCGDNVGDPATDDLASEDPNPDVFAGEGAYWEIIDDELGIAIFHGDPSVGDYVDNNGDGPADAGVAHGTMASGIIASATNNAEGMAGLGWYCKLMAVRMLDAEGIGYGSDAFEALVYAGDMGADVINCSWGAIVDPVDPDPEIAVMQEGVEYAYAHGCVIVAAAGNEALEAGYNWGLDFPACAVETIAVGGSDESDHRIGAASGSFWGSNYANDGQILDVVAPGTFICTTKVNSAAESSEGDPEFGIPPISPGDPNYEQSDGTSFSAPFVSGLAALIISASPGIAQETVRQRIRERAIDLLDPNGDGSNLPGYDRWSGYGRIVIDPRGGPTVVLATQGDAVEEGASVTLSWRATMREALAGFRLYYQAGPAGKKQPLTGELVSAQSGASDRFSIRLPRKAFGPSRYIIQPIGLDGNATGEPLTVAPRKAPAKFDMPRPPM